jgi:hypothetical protein
MEFNLTIKLDKEGMNTTRDLSRKLYDLAFMIDRREKLSEDGGGVHDVNGNKVGIWEIR